MQIIDSANFCTSPQTTEMTHSMRIKNQNFTHTTLTASIRLCTACQLYIILEHELKTCIPGFFYSFSSPIHLKITLTWGTRLNIMIQACQSSLCTTQRKYYFTLIYSSNHCILPFFNSYFQEIEISDQYIFSGFLSGLFVQLVNCTPNPQLNHFFCYRQYATPSLSSPLLCSNSSFCSLRSK